MDNETPKESSSSDQSQSSSGKRTLAIMDEKEYLHKKKKKASEPNSFENVDEDPTKDENVSLERIMARLNAECPLTPPYPRKQEVIGIIIPLAMNKKPILIKGSVSIGKNSSCDIDLTKYGTCENISDHHATLTYDKMTKVFELLNYSRTVTLVDNFAYSNGLSSHVQTNKSKREVKDAVGSKRRKLTNVTEEESQFCEEELNDFCIVENNKVVVPCDVSHHFKTAFAGYAIVKHGSTLRFGCIDFVFCSVDRR